MSDKNAHLLQQLLDSGSITGSLVYMGETMQKGGGVTPTGFTAHMSQPREDGAVQLDCCGSTYLADGWYFPQEALSTFNLNDAQRSNYDMNLHLAGLAEALCPAKTVDGKDIPDTYAVPAPDYGREPPFFGMPLSSFPAYISKLEAQDDK